MNINVLILLRCGLKNVIFSAECECLQTLSHLTQTNKKLFVTFLWFTFSSTFRKKGWIKVVHHESNRAAAVLGEDQVFAPRGGCSPQAAGTRWAETTPRASVLQCATRSVCSHRAERKKRAKDSLLITTRPCDLAAAVWLQGGCHRYAIWGKLTEFELNDVAFVATGVI